MKKGIIDWPTFLGAFILLLLVTIPLILFPDKGAEYVNQANTFVTTNFGVLYLLVGLGIFFFLIYVAFSDNGRVKLGEADEKPEFNNFSWAGMLFCAGIGSSILYWGTIEWAYYYQGPPFGIEPGTKEAIAWASTYGIFHWGPIAWAIYTLPALPMAYFYYVRKKPVLKVSEATRPLIGNLANGPVGTAIDILFMFGLLGGAGTTLALGTPMIAEGINEITGIPVNMVMKTAILAIVTLIFAISAYSGLKKGIKILSDLNLWLSIFLLAFVFLFGPTRFMAETTTNSLGLLLDNFFHMSTWTEPYNALGPYEKTSFPESWTVFYWAWWLVYAPFVGLFVAKISRGRSIRQMILGTIIYGTIGSILFFGIIGNYGLHMQLTGEFDVINVLNNEGAPQAIIEIIGQLPLAWFMIFIFTILAIIFLATTFDSSSYILASVVQKEVEDEPLRWNRLFWAFALCLMPLVLMFLGGLGTLQTAAIVGGFPLLFIMIMLAWSFMRASSEDIRASEHYEPKTFALNYKKIVQRLKRKKKREEKQKGPVDAHFEDEEKDKDHSDETKD
ncbi:MULTISPECIES: BCCT family transporter [Pontibacillus]|uniref:BCCT family transporter n=1 Tax=Pontibacillus chungwhensis TaxID=265426 RepID=A0ABY8V510_9BACI|nr:MULTISPECIES: BCCT family transporter [Pontibacillus]MCD5322382.1 BCCT family transporter [Pontibacillus sp. HN14]WIF99669.1 BCCT family transporter [Pontibacillus chungwhensis]